MYVLFLGMSVHCCQGQRSPSRGGHAYGAGVANVDVQQWPWAVCCAWRGSRVPCAPALHRATSTSLNVPEPGRPFHRRRVPCRWALAAPVISSRVPFRWQLLRPRHRESGQARCAGPYTTFVHVCAQRWTQAQWCPCSAMLFCYQKLILHQYNTWRWICQLNKHAWCPREL
jgi:hypothetical protein